MTTINDAINIANVGLGSIEAVRGMDADEAIMVALPWLLREDTSHYYIDVPDETITVRIPENACMALICRKAERGSINSAPTPVVLLVENDLDEKNKSEALNLLARGWVYDRCVDQRLFEALNDVHVAERALRDWYTHMEIGHLYDPWRRPCLREVRAWNESVGCKVSVCDGPVLCGCRSRTLFVLAKTHGFGWLYRFARKVEEGRV